MATFLSPDKKFFSPTNDDIKEIFRYLGYRKSDLPDSVTAKLVQDCAEEMFAIISPKTVFDTFSLSISGETISFADITLTSHDLSRNLANCKKVTILAATIGPMVDNLIHRNEKIDTVKAAIQQAAGAMFIEKVVDFTNNQIKENVRLENQLCKPRYSPGYGDVPLLIQKDFFRLLPCSKIGLTLMDTLIMAPEKSVTAFIGQQQAD